MTAGPASSAGTGRVDPSQQGAGLGERLLRRDHRVERAVHGDQEPVAHDLVELEQVHVPRAPMSGVCMVTNQWSS